jgi:hypothetical protein
MHSCSVRELDTERDTSLLINCIYYNISKIYRPSEGRFAIVTDVRRDAMDADGASDEGA